MSAADPMESVPGDAAPVLPDITPAAAGPADGVLGGPPRWLRDHQVIITYGNGPQVVLLPSRAPATRRCVGRTHSTC